MLAPTVLAVTVPAFRLGGVAVGLGVVSASGGSDPCEGAGCGLDELPEVMLLKDVVEATEAAEVAGAGTPAPVVGGAVVEVAAPDGLAAGGEAAGPVAGGDEFAEPGRGLVSGSRQGVGAASGGGVGRPPFSGQLNWR